MTQYYLFNSNSGITNAVLPLPDCMAIIASETEELMKKGGEEDVIEYTITASIITREYLEIKEKDLNIPESCIDTTNK